MKKYLIKIPASPVQKDGCTVRTYSNEKTAAILETDLDTDGFDVIAEITDNDFYSDDAIAKRGGRLLTLEIERRWLVKVPDNIGDFSYHSIEQAYLSPESGFQGRIRRLDDKFIYTEKARTGSSAVRIENEREITETEYLSLKDKTILNTIRKRRYIIPYGGLTFELDVFENTADPGFGLMEAELESETDSADIPGFVEIIQEVTDDPYYTNRNLASMEVIRLLKK
ncbi:MAG: hypothetical protein J1F11_12085 [Oscillospiraceae bacterium]|nr:hypothetical protein [Oscillospiraceae bacterium]